MSEPEQRPRPLIRGSDAAEYEAVGAADGMAKGVLIGPDDGAPNFAMRRFTLEPGGTVPRHTNDVEHEQYVLSGEYVVGIEGDVAKEASEGDSLPEIGETDGPYDDLGENEYLVGPGDALLIPARAVHWYRNESDEPGSFLCVVPNGDDEIRVLDEE